MNFYSIIDTSAFIWDDHKFGENAVPYYVLASQLSTFIDTIEKENPKILMRSELLHEILIKFPWKRIEGVVEFSDLPNIVYPFLANLSHRIIEFDAASIDGILSNPDIVYHYYEPNVKQEINFLISKIHAEDTDSVYFTFLPLWIDNTTQLETKVGTQAPKVYKTVIHSKKEFQTFFNSFKHVFTHNPKHDKFISQADKLRGYKIENGEEIFQLSCHNLLDNSYAQSLLSTSIPSPIEPSKLFNYDEKNKTFVCFVATGGNVYHGYDQPLSRIHKSIKKHFFKK